MIARKNLTVKSMKKFSIWGRLYNEVANISNQIKVGRTKMPS